MGFLGKLLGDGAAKPIEAVGGVLDGLFTSEEEKLSKEEALQRLALKPSLAQIALNKVEAAHRSVFVAGWRPFIGWVCGFGLLNTFLLNPWIQWVTGKSGPELPRDVMLELVLAMLGFGIMRTAEKMKGRAK